MSTRQKSSLAQLLGRRGAALSTSGEAKTADKPESTPFFDKVVACASGTETFEALLTRIAGPVDPAMIPQFPTAECLAPEQIYAIDNVGTERRAHLSRCPWCKSWWLSAGSTTVFEQEK
jgi:hypothetical protein